MRRRVKVVSRHEVAARRRNQILRMLRPLHEMHPVGLIPFRAVPVIPTLAMLISEDERRGRLLTPRGSERRVEKPQFEMPFTTQTPKWVMQFPWGFFG